MKRQQDVKFSNDSNVPVNKKRDSFPSPRTPKFKLKKKKKESKKESLMLFVIFFKKGREVERSKGSNTILRKTWPSSSNCFLPWAA